jgi:hypothetical protein
MDPLHRDSSILVDAEGQVAALASPLLACRVLTRDWDRGDYWPGRMAAESLSADPLIGSGTDLHLTDSLFVHGSVSTRCVEELPNGRSSWTNGPRLVCSKDKARGDL